jgi:hypothetical protein
MENNPPTEPPNQADQSDDSVHAPMESNSSQSYIPDAPSAASTDAIQQPVIISPTVIPASAPDVIDSASTPTVAAVVGQTQSEPIAPSLPIAPVVGSQPAEPSSTAPMAPQNPDRKAKKLKLSALILAVVLIFGGGAAAAYKGIVVPNKPANVLKTAIVNSIQQKQGSFVGNLSGSAATSSVAYKASFNGAVDNNAKAVDLHINLTVSGFTFPAEVRLVGGNIYFRVGSLTDLTSLLGSISPSYSALAQSIGSQISNKWFEVDSTLLDETPLKCYLNSNLGVTSDEISMLESQYSAHPFLTIDSTSNDTINNAKAEKFVVSLNDDKAAAYVSGLSSAPELKSLESCAGANNSKDLAKGTSSLADNDTTPLTIWVNKSTKQIVQVSEQSTAQDAKKDNLQASATETFTYGPVSILAPANAEPVTQLISTLEGALGSTKGSTL